MTLTELAERMMLKKIDIPTIADILDCEIDDLYQLRDQLGIEIEREDVVESFNRLSYRAIEKARVVLEAGNPAERLAIMRLFLSMMRKDVGSQSPKEMAALTADFRSTIELHEDDDYEPDDIDEIGEDEAPEANTSH